MRVKTLEIATTGWNQFVEDELQAGFYHLWQWQEISNRVFESSSKSLVVGDGRYQGILPLIFKRGLFKKRLMTPVGDWAGPLGSESIKTELVKQALQLSQQLGAELEIVSGSKQKKGFKGLHQTSDHSYFILKTDRNYEEIFKERFHKKTRNMIRKAKKEGVVVTAGEINDLENFYHLYLKTMRKLGAIPLPKAVFVAVQEKLGQYARLVAATYQGRPAGFLLVFCWKSTAWVWANVTDQEYLRLGVNYALWAKAIELACQDKKITKLNCGSSQKKSSQEFFKLRWGAKPKPIYFITNNLNLIKERQETVGRFERVLRYLPLPVFRFVGEAAYRLC